MSSVFQNIDPPPPGECVPPRLRCGGRTHSLGGDGGEYFGRCQTLLSRTLHMYVSILCGITNGAPMRSAPLGARNKESTKLHLKFKSAPNRSLSPNNTVDIAFTSPSFRYQQRSRSAKGKKLGAEFKSRTSKSPLPHLIAVEIWLRWDPLYSIYGSPLQGGLPSRDLWTQVNARSLKGNVFNLQLCVTAGSTYINAYLLRQEGKTIRT
jgi:hypothetical protein